MGFCLFNNIALGAEAALEHESINRVAILDWDVHHGNGTQDIFYERSDVMFASIHQHPLYPGTGMKDERGRGGGVGYTVNCPMSAGTHDATFLEAWSETIRPAFEAFEPDLILISAGFDADARDPLGGLSLTPNAFETITSNVVESAKAWCHGRVVSSLEGGYNVQALAEDVSVHLDALIG
jgi:acetoin utilization deacetylase AcuC-like enzyme